MALDYFATQNGAAYSAEVTRRAMFSWAARTGANSPGIVAGGLMSATDLQVTAPASGMTVNIGVGEGLIGGSEGGSQGGYYFRNSASYSASVAAANATNPRIDAVVATMADGGYTQPSDVGGTTNGPVFAVVTGTPTAGATLSNLSGAPAIPASSLLLAWLLVPAAAGSIVGADISNVAKVAQTGVFGSGPTQTYVGTSQSLGTGWSLVLTNTIGTDPGGNLVNNGANYVYRVPAAGTYLLAGLVQSTAANSPQEYGIGFAVSSTSAGSGTPNLQFYQSMVRSPTGGDPMGLPLTVIQPLSAGTFINLCAYNNGGNNLTLSGDAQQTQFSAMRVA